MINSETFLTTLSSSALPQQSFYKKVHKLSISGSLKYLIRLSIVLSLFITTIFAIKFISTYRNTPFKTALYKLFDRYPNDLTITVKDGTLMSSYDRPFILFFEYKDIPHQFLVVDTYITKASADNYDAPVILSSDGIIIKSDGAQEVIPYENTGSLTINKSAVLEFKNTLTKIFSLLPLFMLLGFIFIFLCLTFALVISRLLFMGFLSILIFLISKLFITKITFQNTFKITLFATTIPFILESVLSVFSMNVTIPFWFLILNGVFAFSGIYEAFYDR